MRMLSLVEGVTIMLLCRTLLFVVHAENVRGGGDRGLPSLSREGRG